MITSKNNMPGFTILELMIVLTIAGILSAIAIPSFTVFIKNNCMTTKAVLLVNSLQFARSEAIKRKESIALRTNPSVGNNANEWGGGWRITDAGWPGWSASATDIERHTLRIIETTCETTAMDEIRNPGRGDTTDNDRDFVYRPTGFIDSPGTINVCDDRTGETGRQITISVTGRPNTNSNFTCS